MVVLVALVSIGGAIENESTPVVRGRVTLVGEGVAGDLLRVYITDENLDGVPKLVTTAVVDREGKWSAQISLVPNHILKIEVALVDNTGDEGEKELFGYFMFQSRALSKKPDEVPKPKGLVYKYIELSIPLPENVEVEFRVPRAWLEKNSIAPESVELMRYDNQWIELPTTRLREDNSFVYYKALVQGSSTFAISAKRIAFPLLEPLALVLIVGGAVGYAFWFRLKRCRSVLIFRGWYSALMESARSDQASKN
jgi:hypothetical protein